MKKIIASILITCIVFSIVTAFACESEPPALPIIENGIMSCSGYAYFALDESLHICAKISVNENVPVFNSSLSESAYVRGIVGNGIIRSKGEVRYLNIGGMLCGVTKIKCSVTIKEEFTQAVQSIIDRRIENDSEMNANTIIACTMWRTQDTISHMMFTSNTSYAHVGTLMINECTAPICIGDFDGDGLFELGFPAGSWIEEKESDPEPEIVTVINNNYYVTEKTETSVCNKIVQDIRQINVNSNVINNQKQIVNINTKKNPCQKVKCLE